MEARRKRKRHQKYASLDGKDSSDSSDSEIIKKRTLPAAQKMPIEAVVGAGGSVFAPNMSTEAAIGDGKNVLAPNMLIEAVVGGGGSVLTPLHIFNAGNNTELETNYINIDDNNDNTLLRSPSVISIPISSDSTPADTLSYPSLMLAIPIWTMIL